MATARCGALDWLQSWVDTRDQQQLLLLLRAKTTGGNIGSLF